MVTSEKVGISDPDSFGLSKHLSIEKKIPAADLTAKVSPSVQLQSVTGEKKAIVILINFTDVGQNAAHTPAYYNNLLFNTSDGANSMTNYYEEVSYDNINITGTTGSGWYTASHNMDWYGADVTDIDENTTQPDRNEWYIFKLAKEAVQLADPAINYSDYDTDGDDVIDHLIIVHAGNGQESSGNTNDIWSHKWSIYEWTGAAWNLGYMTNDGVRAVGYTMLAENSPVGTFAHEFGHDIGLPDLYDTDSGIDYGAVVGDWGLMDGGSWNNGGNTPAHMTAWCKAELGWITPQIITSPSTVSVSQAENNSEAHRINISANEYFLIENRQAVVGSYDQYIPESGILIYHIDTSMPDNIGNTNPPVRDNDGPPDNSYYKVQLEQPGGSGTDTHGNPFGGPNYRGAIPTAAYSLDDCQFVFNPIIAPNSSSNDGTKTNISIITMSREGSVMNVTINPNTTESEAAIQAGLAWLHRNQSIGGSWQNSVGITSMAALAFLNAGHTEENPTVNKAIQYILTERNADGSFGVQRTYETSLAVLALVATHNASYNDEIADARDWLVDAQYDEGEGADPTDACYGGWRYGYSPGDGDLSNTQFALMALSAAGLPSGSDTWTKAITFTSRCQNRPASNDQAWAHDNTQPSYNDGGFIYHPGGWSLAGGSESYGSMTSAGIWSLRLCGVDVSDGRVQAGLTWLTNNEDCSFDDNPGHPYGQGHCFLYYYYMTTAKALSMCFLNDLGGVDWYAAISTKLADLQHDDGHWVNAPASHGQEDIPEVATDYALLALQTRQPPAAALWMSIILASNAELCVYDPQGRHACLGDVTIPGATFEIDEEGRHIVNLTELEAGKYRIELKGTADGGYSLTIEGYRGDEKTSSETFEGTIEEGEYQKSDVLVTSMVGALTIYVEEPEPLLVTDLPNVELVSADLTVTSINVTSLNLSEINETYKPEECITPQSAYMVNSTGAGNFMLKFTDIPNANTIIVYKINETNQWIELDATTTADTVTFTMSVEDPPVIFCSGVLPVPVLQFNQTGLLALFSILVIFVVGWSWSVKRK